MSVKEKFSLYQFSSMTLRMSGSSSASKDKNLFFAFYRAVGHSQDKRVSPLGAASDYYVDTNVLQARQLRKIKKGVLREEQKTRLAH